MLHIIQSQRIERLFAHLLDTFAHPPMLDVFDMHEVLIPSHGIGAWLKMQLANHLGICAQVNTNFIGSYQWKLYAAILGEEAALSSPVSANIMQWQIFSYLLKYIYLLQKNSKTPLDDKTQATLSILAPLTQKILSVVQTENFNQHTDITLLKTQIHSKAWQIAGQVAQVFATYVVYRPEWLFSWGKGQLLDLASLLKKLNQTVPEWELQRYNAMQPWQAHLWQALFFKAFAAREKRKMDFWHVLYSDSSKRRLLPKKITVFTLIQLPEAELHFLQQLAQYTDITILHYNPTPEYWADSVDPRWLAKIQLNDPIRAASYDSRHPLLTRFGKQAREVFALLSRLSGQEDNSTWHDDFIFPDTALTPISLLTQIQQDVFKLTSVDESPHLYLTENDQSIQIHACHSSMRQLEVLHDALIAWLANDASHQPSDVVVFASDLEKIEPLIRAVFSSSNKQNIPFEITGIASTDALVLWQAMSSQYVLLNGRVTLTEWLDWISLAPMQQAYGLDREQIARIEVLLAGAGFRRGFDELHIRKTLHAHDLDTRYTLRFALDRLILAMAMPVQAIHADCVPFTQVMRDDFTLIATLEQIFCDVSAVRHYVDDIEKPVKDWLLLLRNHLAHLFSREKDNQGWIGVQQAFNDLENLLDSMTEVQTQLPLPFVLKEITNLLEQAPPGAVPSGRVTFARLGMLRPLPYKLVVMLDLNAGQFPKRQQPASFDLMGLFPPKLGDRSRLDDEQGAFLDAILLAQDACWIFYNGFDVNDPHPRQPATPVQELLDFLCKYVINTNPTASAITQTSAPSTPEALQQHVVYQQLVKQHTLQPFEADNFKPPHPSGIAGVWLDVANTLQKPAETVIWANKPLARHVAVDTANKMIDSRQWIKALLAPARFFLTQAGIRQLYSTEEIKAFEPLTLNALDAYQLRELHLQANQAGRKLQAALVPDILPVGVVKNAYWEMSYLHAQHMLERLALFGTVSPITEQPLNLFDRQWQVIAPTDINCTCWISMYAKGSGAKHKVSFWLEHLLWQVWRGTTMQQVQAKDGCRIGIFSKETLRLPALSKADAIDYLWAWFNAWQAAGKMPWVLPVTHGFNAIDKYGEISITPDIINRWQGTAYASVIPPREDIDCMLHPDWQLILQGSDALLLLEQFINRHAQALYLPIHQQLEDITTTHGGDVNEFA